MIEVTRKAGADPLVFEIVVRDGSGESRHQVTMARALCARLAGSEQNAAACIEAAFRFLLERESKESILARFDVGVIQHYFPDFERALPRYLKRG